MNKKHGFGSTIGVGYVSIMLIFTVICLTIFAVLSYQAVYSDSRLGSRSEEFDQQYYSADAAAKKLLAELDEAALSAQEGFSFEESFSEAAGELGATAVRVPEGIRADYSVDIGGRRRLDVSVLFYSAPAEERFSIIKWQADVSGGMEEQHPSVWDGGDLM